MALLKLENVTVNYGSINALRGINLEVNEGEVVTLIGSNGAGKSTTMRTVMGLKYCDQGKITFNGEDITNKDTQYMVRKGMILSPEGRQVFPRFSVLDNLRMGAYSRPDQEMEGSLETVFSLFPKLYDRREQLAGTLSGGEQQRVALARALANNAEIIIADEPTGNLDPARSLEIMTLLERINALGTTVIVVTHERGLVNHFNKRIILLNEGRVIGDGMGSYEV